MYRIFIELLQGHGDNRAFSLIPHDHLAPFKLMSLYQGLNKTFIFLDNPL